MTERTDQAALGPWRLDTNTPPVNRGLAAAPESDVQTSVRNDAAQYGWRHYHTHNSQRSEPGWPDSFLVKGPYAVVAELKKEGAKLPTEQREWLEALNGVRRVYPIVVRPSSVDRLSFALARPDLAFVHPEDEALRWCEIMEADLSFRHDAVGRLNFLVKLPNVPAVRAQSLVGAVRALQAYLEDHPDVVTNRPHLPGGRG